MMVLKFIVCYKSSLLQPCRTWLISTEIWTAVCHFTVVSFLLCSLVIPAWQSLAMIALGSLLSVKRKFFQESDNLSPIWNSYSESNFDRVCVSFITFLEFSFLFLNKSLDKSFLLHWQRKEAMGEKQVFCYFERSFYFSVNTRWEKVLTRKKHDSYLFLINNKLSHTEDLAVYIIKYKLWE